MFKTESGTYASSSSEAYGFWRTVNFVVKVLLCLLFFCLVLGSAVLSKLTLLVMVFSINPLQLDTVLPGLGNTTTGLVVKVRTRVILRQTMDTVICLRLDSFLLLHRFPAARLRPRIAPPPPLWFFVCFFLSRLASRKNQIAQGEDRVRVNSWAIPCRGDILRGVTSSWTL